MDMDLLSWLVGVVLTRRADHKMVRAGELAPEDAAASDPIFCAPFVISYRARKQIDDWNDEGLTDRYPPFLIGVDERDNAYALGAIRLSSGDYAVATAGMSYQGFFGLAEDLLEEIIYINLAATAAAVLHGRHVSTAFDTLQELARKFVRERNIRHAFVIHPETGEIGRLG